MIVKDGAVIGQGHHQRFGGAHAEVNALADCRNRGHNPADATLYVTLEPCSHTGKTPPCSQAVIEAKIAKVVIAAEDPTDLAGGGIEALKQAGIKVEVGLCRDEAEKLNAPFY
ncbi:MAG: bifunctional diaminohydroxyphosphoribosylaminopyrimidine deaminase/5-amino-6-(5-phosphoribosylamino)uracil reductase RibD, partial [Planctomycetota bacterium]